MAIPRNRLAEQRERSRLTQKEVATLLGIDHTTVNKHERHLRGMTPEQVRKYADLYKVETYELFVNPADLGAPDVNHAESST